MGTLLTLSLLLCGPVSSAADEWPQFRGPGGQGHATAQNIPAEWSEAKDGAAAKNITWKTAIPGSGYSSPMLGRGLAWMTSSKEDGRSLWVVAVDLKDGHIVHQREVLRTDKPPFINVKNSHASPSPVLEGDRIYVHYGTSGTACLSTENCETVWTNNDLKIDHGEGPGSSPILYKDLMIVNCDGRDKQYVVALDKRTGKEVWKTDRTGEMPPSLDERKSFCTPLVIEHDGKDQLIDPGAQRIIAYDPNDGKELWNVCYTPGYSVVPRPVLGKNLIYICTGYMKPELWAIRTGGAGDVTSSHVAWKVKRNAPTNPSPLLDGNELYMVSDTGIATCMNAETGEEIWKQRLGDTYWASPLMVDGKIYFWSEGGETVVIAPGKEFKELARNKLDDGFMASPAVIDSALIVRTKSALYRIENPPASAKPEAAAAAN